MKEAMGVQFSQTFSTGMDDDEYHRVETRLSAPTSMTIIETPRRPGPRLVVGNPESAGPLIGLGPSA
jgi:hypothetical protein